MSHYSYIVIAVSGIVLLADSFLDILSKPILGAILGILVFSLLHVTIKEAVVEAMKEARDL